MTNKEAVEIFDQAHSSEVAQLFWIAASLENRRNLEDFMEEMTDEDIMQCFPEIAKSQYFESYKEGRELTQALVNFEKFGLLAQILVPECSKFNYNGKKPVSWSVNSGTCRIAYIYAETMEGLAAEVVKASERIFKQYVAKDKKKKAAQRTKI